MWVALLSGKVCAVDVRSVNAPAITTLTNTIAAAIAVVVVVAQHNRRHHPHLHIEKKLDGHNRLRKGVITGQIKFQSILERSATPETIKLLKKGRGCIPTREESRDVKITARILGKQLTDPYIEGVETWCAEPFEHMGQRFSHTLVFFKNLTNGFGSLAATFDFTPMYHTRVYA